EPAGGDAVKGAFLSPVLLHCGNPAHSRHVHTTEAFGPVSTVLPYDDLDQAIDLAQRGEGSLVASIFTYDPAVAIELTMGMAAYHGRLIHVDRDCAKESTGMDRRCLAWSTAGRAGPEAARSLAASGEYSTTCSARPCKGRPRDWRHSQRPG